MIFDTFEPRHTQGGMRDGVTNLNWNLPQLAKVASTFCADEVRSTSYSVLCTLYLHRKMLMKLYYV
jgi:hypothetical protein